MRGAVKLYFVLHKLIYIFMMQNMDNIFNNSGKEGFISFW